MMLNLITLFFVIFVVILVVQAFVAWMDLRDTCWARTLVMRICSYFKPKKHNPFKEFTDIPAEELADLYSGEQLRKSYNDCLECSFDSNTNRERVLNHFRAAWMVATIRAGLDSKPKENKKAE